MEEAIISVLKRLKKEKKYIALHLHPAVGHSIIEREGNILRINDGREGKWEGVSESFYDEMVKQFDSRK
jgi:hypothetical protein